jgi:hypothetical protein
MFHVVYSRHYWDVDHQDGDSMFSNTWTLYRNVSYSQIGDMQGKILIMKAKADKAYAKAEKKQRQQEDPEQFEKSEVYIVDDRDYFKTYKSVYPDVYIGPAGLIPASEDYYYSYGQKTDFMLIKDFDEFYTWYAKDWTQEQIQTEYKKRDKETA